MNIGNNTGRFASMTTISPYWTPVEFPAAVSKNAQTIVDDSGNNQKSQAASVNLIGADAAQALKANLNIKPRKIDQFREKEIEDIKPLILGVLGARHSATRQHSMGVAMYTREFCKSLGLPTEKIKKIEMGALCHDIGKISLPDDFFNQKNLTPTVKCVYKSHPVQSYNILSRVAPLSKNIALIAKCHHEKYDGTGYPEGLKGNQIPIGARIVAVADAFDSMTRKKYPKQKVKTFEEAIKVIRENRSGQWDPALTEPFIRVITADSNQLYKKVLFST